MSKNKGGQGGQQQQQPQIPEIILSTKIVGKTVFLDIQVKSGNRAIANQRLEIYVDNQLLGITVLTDSNGVASATTPSLDPGLRTVKVQFSGGVTKNSVVVEIPKDFKPGWKVDVLRVENKVSIFVSGPQNGKFTYYDGEVVKEDGNLGEDGVFKFDVSLETDEEKEVWIYSLGQKTFRRSFRGYDLQESDNDLGFLDVRVEDTDSPNMFRMHVVNSSLKVSNPIWAIVAFCSFLGWCAILTFANSETSVPYAAFWQVALFVIFCYSSYHTRLNNSLAILMLITVLGSWAIFFAQPGGEPLLDKILRHLYEQDQMLQNYSPFAPTNYSGEGTWLWLVLALLFTFEFPIFLPFAFSDEFRLAVRRAKEVWEQRSFQMSESSAPVSAKFEKVEDKSGEKVSFWARIWDKMDEAIMADVGLDIAKNFGRSVLTKFR